MKDNIRGYIDLQVRSSDFKHFLLGFEQLLINIEGFKLNLTVVLDQYNTRSRSWWAFNINKPEGMQLDALSPSYGVQQLVTEPTHILTNSSSSMDLIFTDQPSMVFNSFSSC